jgi:uncharacterized membrane protein
MNFCTKCGSSVIGMKFCNNCGASLIDAADQDANNRATRDLSPNNAASETLINREKKETLDFIYLLFALGLFAGLPMIFGAVMLYINWDKKDDGIFESHYSKLASLFWKWLLITPILFLICLLFFTGGYFSLWAFVRNIFAIGFIYLIEVCLFLYYVMTGWRKLTRLEKA